jgi:hypothetical protein
MKHFKLSSRELKVAVESLNAEEKRFNEAKAILEEAGGTVGGTNNAIKKRQGELNLYSKTLVSCLRALSHSLNAAVEYSAFHENIPSSAFYKGEGTPSKHANDIHGEYMVPNFANYFHSLVQLAYQLFCKELPKVLEGQDLILKPTTELPKDAGTEERRREYSPANYHPGCEDVPEPDIKDKIKEQMVKLWSHALKFYSSLAQYDPSVFISSWPLFISDSQSVDAHLESIIANMMEVLDRQKSMTQPNPYFALDYTKKGIEHIVHMKQDDARTKKASTKCDVTDMIPRFKSPILFACCWAADPGVRIAAASCIKSMVHRYNLRAWFKSFRSSKMTMAMNRGFMDDKVVSNVTKLLRFVVLMISLEREPTVMQVLLETGLFLVQQLPLSTLDKKMNPRLSFIEELVTLLFREVLVSACHNNAIYSLRAVTSPEDALEQEEGLSHIKEILTSVKKTSGSVYAWRIIESFLFLLPNARALSRALELPCYMIYDEVLCDWRTVGTISSTAFNPRYFATDMEEIEELAPKGFIFLGGDVCLGHGMQHALSYGSCAFLQYTRSLQNTLLSNFSHLFLKKESRPWTKQFIQKCVDAKTLVGSGLLAGRMLTSIFARMKEECLRELGTIGDTSGNGAYEDTLVGSAAFRSDGYTLDVREEAARRDQDKQEVNQGFYEKYNKYLDIGGMGIVEATLILLRCCRDNDHLVRGQGVTCFGQYNFIQWRYLRHQVRFLSYRTDVIPHSAAEMLGIDGSVRAAIIQCLITACGDNVGTARASAQKSLGESIIMGGVEINAPRSNNGSKKGVKDATKDGRSGNPGDRKTKSRHIFIAADTNHVEKRIEQAQQVQAEAFELAMSQAAAEAKYQKKTLSERLEVSIQETGADRADESKMQRRSHQIDRSIVYELPERQNFRQDIESGAIRDVMLGDEYINSVAIGEYKDVLVAMLECFLLGCQDSKLSVRLQSTWGLGNLLLLILPLRQRLVFHTNDMIPGATNNSVTGTDVADAKATAAKFYNGEGNSDLADMDAPWIKDDIWSSQLCPALLRLLDDSDKIVASTVRCLGFVCAGLSPWDPNHFGYLSNIVHTLVQKILLSGMESQLHQDRSQYMKRCIEHYPQKLVFSVCQSLAFIGWVLVWRGDNDCGGVASTVTECIGNVRLVQAELMRFGKIKVKIQACKALISLTHNYNEKDAGPLEDVEGAFDPYDIYDVNENNSIAGGRKGTYNDYSYPVFLKSQTEHRVHDNTSQEGDNVFSLMLRESRVQPMSSTTSVVKASIDEVIPAQRRDEIVDTIASPSGRIQEQEQKHRDMSLIKALEACLFVATNAEVIDPTITDMPGTKINSEKLMTAIEVRLQTEKEKKANDSPGKTSASHETDSEQLDPANRKTALERTVVVLLWVMLRRAYDTRSYGNSGNTATTKALSMVSDDFLATVIDMILFHSDSLAEWLVRMYEDDHPIEDEELSSASSPLLSTVPRVAVKRDSSPRSLVPLLSRRILKIIGFRIKYDSFVRNSTGGSSSFATSLGATTKHLTENTELILKTLSLDIPVGKLSIEHLKSPSKLVSTTSVHEIESEMDGVAEEEEEDEI